MIVQPQRNRNTLWNFAGKESLDQSKKSPRVREPNFPCIYSVSLLKTKKKSSRLRAEIFLKFTWLFGVLVRDFADLSDFGQTDVQFYQGIIVVENKSGFYGQQTGIWPESLKNGIVPLKLGRMISLRISHVLISL